MTDLKNGVIDINGVLVHKDSKISDFESLPEGTVKIEKSRRGDTFITFCKPLCAGNVKMRVSVDFYINHHYPEIEFRPNVRGKVPEGDWGGCKTALNASKQWLKAFTGMEPSIENDTYICYKFKTHRFSALVTDDIHYGQTGGDVNLIFFEE